ncbi:MULTISPECIES: 6-carboxyhexanoate--CoA ligase [Persephonella]
MMYYSIKLRASRDGKHLSGGERIVLKDKIEEAVNQLYRKAEPKDPDEINIKIESIKEKPLVIKSSLKIENIICEDYKSSNQIALEILKRSTGIPVERLKELIDLVHTGSAPDGSNMRGAMIVNQKGERIELDHFRGIRTTTVDFLDRDKILKKLVKKGYTERTVDALCLTTKNMLYPDMIAEYCISDEPDYITGYVSTKDFYYRITPLKSEGNPKGGRIYFVRNSIDLQDFYRFLQEKPVLIEDVGID